MFYNKKNNTKNNRSTNNNNNNNNSNNSNNNNINYEFVSLSFCENSKYVSLLEKKQRKVYLIDIVNSPVIVNEYQIINK
jgi:hypothetical protein